MPRQTAQHVVRSLLSHAILYPAYLWLVPCHAPLSRASLTRCLRCLTMLCCCSLKSANILIQGDYRAKIAGVHISPCLAADYLGWLIGALCAELNLDRLLVLHLPQLVMPGQEPRQIWAAALASPTAQDAANAACLRTAHVAGFASRAALDADLAELQMWACPRR